MFTFLTLCEEFNPKNTSDPKWQLIDFLKSKGINVSPVRDTDMLYIDTGSGAVSITVSNNEEEAESINADYGDYNVNDEVEGLANKAEKGLKGAVGKLMGNPAQQAKQALKKRQGVSKQAVRVYDKKTQKLQQDLRNVQ